MKGKIAYLFAVVALAVVSFAAMRRATPQVVLHDVPISVREFTIVQNTHDPDGKIILSRTIERRSDGAMASTTAGLPVRKITSGDGITYLIYDPLEMLVKWKDPNVRGLAGKKLVAVAPGNCEMIGDGATTTVLRHENILNLDTAVLRSGTPDNAFMVETAYAPALGCQPVRIVTYENGALTATISTDELRLDQIDAWLFAIPDNYQSVKPSDGLRALAKYQGQPWNDTLQAEADKKDAIYATGKP